MPKNDFFIGWSPEMPTIDRRFFLGSGVALTLGTGAIAAGVASGQNPPQPGGWNMGEVRDFKGVATAEPYAMLRTTDVDGTPKTVLLGCQGKCGVSAKIGALSGKAVTVKGSLIQRGPYAMIAVIDGLDWIREDTEGNASLAFPAIETLGEIKLKGEILDTKCWFGAMNPNQGKVHKACASLCIRGGLPPAFYVKDIRDQQALMIMTDRGLAHGKDLLEFVADPVELTATAKRWGDLLLVDSPVSGIRRL
jgi:hypothetical protein